MRALIVVMIFASTVLITSCETPLKVTSDYDKSVDFKRYSTFSMLDMSSRDQALSQLNANRIINAVKAEMIKKGYTEDSNAPDLKVNVVAILTPKSELSSSTNYYGYGGAYRPYGWGAGSGGYTTYNVRDFTEGSLIIEVIDADESKLIWEGIGNKEIDKPSKDPDKTIPEAIAKIMKDFPPDAAAIAKKK